jgi:hypothetical protein
MTSTKAAECFLGCMAPRLAAAFQVINVGGGDVAGDRLAKRNRSQNRRDQTGKPVDSGNQKTKFIMMIARTGCGAAALPADIRR